MESKGTIFRQTQSCSSWFCRVWMAIRLVTEWLCPSFSVVATAGNAQGVGRQYVRQSIQPVNLGGWCRCVKTQFQAWEMRHEIPIASEYRTLFGTFFVSLLSGARTARLHNAWRLRRVCGYSTCRSKCELDASKGTYQFAVSICEHQQLY